MPPPPPPPQRQTVVVQDGFDAGARFSVGATPNIPVRISQCPSFSRMKTERLRNQVKNIANSPRGWKLSGFWSHVCVAPNPTPSPNDNALGPYSLDSFSASKKTLTTAPKWGCESFFFNQVDTTSPNVQWLFVLHLRCVPTTPPVPTGLLTNVSLNSVEYWLNFENESVSTSKQKATLSTVKAQLPWTCIPSTSGDGTVNATFVCLCTVCVCVVAATAREDSETPWTCWANSMLVICRTFPFSLIPLLKYDHIKATTRTRTLEVGKANEPQL